MWKKIAISAAVGAAILGTGTAALAASGSSSLAGSTPTPTSTASGSTATGSTGTGTGTGTGSGAKGDGARKLALRLSKVEHAEWVTRDKDADVTHDAVGGVVTAVSPTSISVKATDGFSATYTVDTTTKVHVKGGGKTISDVKVNDRVLVSGVKSASALTAAQVVDAGPQK
jgi:hypothetical protein